MSTMQAEAEHTGSVKVIVGLRVPFAPQLQLSAAEAEQQLAEIATASAAVQQRFAAAIQRWPNSFRAYGTLPFLAMEVTPEELARLKTDPTVLSVTENGTVETKLSRSVPMIRAPEAWASGNFTGLTETVAVLDTGIDKTHPFLAGKVVSEACFTQGDCPGGNTSASISPGSGMPCTNLGCYHGTHVAGIIAGSSGTLSGVAPGAKLISIRVLTSISNGRFSDVAAGLERVFELRNTYKIAAVNLSLGDAGLYNSHCDGSTQRLVESAVNQLTSAGIAVVAASGNASSSEFETGISFPACLSNVISVGAVSTSNWGTCFGAPTAADKVACFSFTAPILSLLAPGALIYSSVPGGLFKTEYGTSMAAPHVAGAIAILRQKAPNASVGDILNALQKTGVPVTDYRAPGITTPRIDVKAALDEIKGGYNDGKYPLDVAFSGEGSGTVTFTPAGTVASCTTDCSSRFDPGTAVTLTAAPASSASYFFGWAGPCTGTGSCNLTMGAGQAVRAIFYRVANGAPRQLSVTRQGEGLRSLTITANGGNMPCPQDSCTGTYPRGTRVVITAAPEPGYALAGWSGACRGTRPTCVVKMTADRTVAASFRKLPDYTLSFTRLGAGDGVVDVAVNGVVTSWTASTQGSYPMGTKVTLTARPGSNATFSRWSGICRGNKKSCSFTLRRDTSVWASFN